MSYVSVNAPLPRNGRSPIPQCEIDAARATVNNVEALARAGKLAGSQIASPQSFAGLGQGVQRDVARSQAELISANRYQTLAQTQPTTAATRRELIRSAPNVIPLNVPPEQFAGCSIRGTSAPLPVTVSEDQQRVIMPPPAPTDTQLLMPGNTGMVSVPIASPSPSVIFMGPGATPAPPPRPMHYFGYAGYRGMGSVAWGDAIADPGPRNGNGSAGMSGKNLLLLGLAGLGLYAVTRKGRR